MVKNGSILWNLWKGRISQYGGGSKVCVCVGMGSALEPALTDQVLIPDPVFFKSASD